MILNRFFVLLSVNWGANREKSTFVTGVILLESVVGFASERVAVFNRNG